MGWKSILRYVTKQANVYSKVYERVTLPREIEYPHKLRLSKSLGLCVDLLCAMIAKYGAEITVERGRINRQWGVDVKWLYDWKWEG